VSEYNNKELRDKFLSKGDFLLKNNKKGSRYSNYINPLYNSNTNNSVFTKIVIFLKKVIIRVFIFIFLSIIMIIFLKGK